MKKILALCIAVASVSAAFAQSTRDIENAKDVILGPKKGSGGSGTSNPKDVVLDGDRRVYDNNGSRYPNSSREAEIDRVNRDYDQRIYDIRNNRNLSSAEKERRIRELEAERSRRIRQINDRYYGNNDRNTTRDRRYDDDDRYAKKNNKKYKTNNGNHYGWEKGVGNPHKSGGRSSNGNGNGNGKGKGKKN